MHMPSMIRMQRDTMVRRGGGNGHLQRDLGALIDLYLLRCQVEGKSAQTVRAYAETLRRFAKIAHQEGFPAGLIDRIDDL